MVRIQFEDGPYRDHVAVVERGEKVGTELIILPSLDRVVRYRLSPAGNALHRAQLVSLPPIAHRREGS